jgi:hypothetical protein
MTKRNSHKPPMMFTLEVKKGLFILARKTEQRVIAGCVSLWVSTGNGGKSSWMNAVSIPEGGRPAIAFDRYRDFVQSFLDAGSYTRFGKLIVCGETLVGVPLILGAITGIAAFFGASINWNFMMACTARTNPLMFFFSFGLILTRKVAGQVGLDRALLDRLGVPRQWELPSVEPELKTGELVRVVDWRVVYRYTTKRARQQYFAHF